MPVVVVPGGGVIARLAIDELELRNRDVRWVTVVLVVVVTIVVVVVVVVVVVTIVVVVAIPSSSRQQFRLEAVHRVNQRDVIVIALEVSGDVLCPRELGCVEIDEHFRGSDVGDEIALWIPTMSHLARTHRFSKSIWSPEICSVQSQRAKNAA